LKEDRGASTNNPDTIEDEDVRELAELRSSLQERISRLESELHEWRTLLSILDQRLGQVSFKKARIPEVAEVKETERPRTAEAPPEVEYEYERTAQLKATTGMPLAEIQIGNNVLRVIPAKGVKLKTNIPPFEAFLINRIFKEMIKHDEESDKNGRLPPDSRFAYEIAEAEDGTIREILIKNYRTDRRLRELRTSLRWTLDKMYEKASKT